MPKEVVLIAAVTVDGFIARHHHEATTWSKDLHLFKKQTMGHPVIMGSNTHATFATELTERDIIVVHRNDDPKKTLSSIKADRCFVIGGGKTFVRFSSHLTHLFITPHPLVFGKGIRLFDGKMAELRLSFQKLIPVDKNTGIFQYQYAIQSR